MSFRYKGAAATACALVLVACQPEPARTAPEHEPETTDAAAIDSVCITRYAGSGEIASTGELVQLDVTFRYQAKRSGAMEARDTSMSLDAESIVEGTASQLACLWEQLDGSPGKFDLRAPGSIEGVRFPRRQDGHARLSGTRILQADGMTAHEEVDVSGELETLAVKSIGVRGTHDSDACVTLGFDIPLHGRSVRTISTPGISKEEAIYPSALVTSSYSALSPRSFGENDHRFLNTSFSICTGPELDGQGASSGSPRGLTISPDSRLWQRSGRWSGHAAGRNETREVDFTMRVVPPSPGLRTELASRLSGRQ
ncbi:MAG: hypothetical protein ACTH0Y_12070 [Luteimonas sp.]